jgi:hypothetical protein
MPYAPSGATGNMNEWMNISQDTQCSAFSIRPNWLIHWNWALVEKSPVMQLLKNFPAFYRTRRFITALTRALHVSPRSDQSSRYRPALSKTTLGLLHCDMISSFCPVISKVREAPVINIYRISCNSVPVSSLARLDTTRFITISLCQCILCCSHLHTKAVVLCFKLGHPNYKCVTEVSLITETKELKIKVWKR